MDKEKLIDFIDRLEKTIGQGQAGTEDMPLLNMIASALENAVYHWTNQEKCESLLKIWKSKTVSTIIAISNCDSKIDPRLLYDANTLLLDWMSEIDAMINECSHSL